MFFSKEIQQRCLMSNSYRINNYLQIGSNEATSFLLNNSRLLNTLALTQVQDRRLQQEEATFGFLMDKISTR